MNYQLNAFGRTLIKKNLILYILAIIVYLLISYNIINRPLIPPAKEDLITLLGYYPSFSQINLDMNLLVVMFHFCLTFYTCYTFINYEKNNSAEFIYLRTKRKKSLNQKLIINLIFIILWRSLYFYFVYYEYNMKMNITIKDFLISIAIHSTLVLIIHFLYQIRIKFEKC